MWPPLPLVAVLFALVLTAAVFDLARRRIPNEVNALVAVAGMGVQLVRGPQALVAGVLACALTVALLWRPWRRGGIGAGDVKLAGAVALWIPLPLMPVFLLATALTGGFVALLAYAASSRVARREMRFNVGKAVVLRAWPEVRRAAGRVSVPYGVAIAAGTAITYVYGA